MKIPPKPKRGKRSPFYWWRRWKSHKYLPTKKGLLARILNGDFEYPDQFEWAKYETHYMQDELDAFVKNYNTKQRIEYLISHGSISVLGSEIGKKHNFDTPREGWTWHSEYKNEDELLMTYSKDSWAEFIYIYKNKKWYVKQNNIDTYNILSEQINYVKEI